MNMDYMPQHLKFNWAFLRRHIVVKVDQMLDSHMKNDLMLLCEMELAQLAVDRDGKPICFFLRCAADAMYPEAKQP